MVVELGRYIVGECGVYVTRIVDRKESRGKIFLVVDGGLHHQLAASGNFGQVIRRNYPVAIAGRAADAETEQVTRRRLPVHAARPARRRRRAPPSGDRRPRRHLPGGRLRAHRQPHRLPRPSGSGRSAGLAPTRVTALAIVLGLPGLAAAAPPRRCWPWRRGSTATPRGRRASRALPRARPRPQRGARHRPLPRGDRRRPAARRPGAGGRRSLHRRDGGDRPPLRRLVLERGPDEEPGRAAARQAGLEHARALEWDAVVMLDADSVIAPGFFDACERGPGPGRRRGAGAQREQARPHPGHARRRSPRSRCRASRSRAAETGSVSRSACAAPAWRSADRWRSRTASARRPRRTSSSRSTCILDGVRCRHVDAARLRSQGASTLEHVRRPEGPLRGRPHGGRARLRAAAAPARASATATPPRSRRRGSSPPRRSRSPPSRCWSALALAAIAQPGRSRPCSRAGAGHARLVILTGLIQARAGLRTWLALLVGPVVPRMEGGHPAARARQRPPARRLLPADRAAPEGRVQWRLPAWALVLMVPTRWQPW